MVRCLTKDEESMLRVMEKVGGRVGNRAKIILLSSKWYKVKEIAHILGINQVTVSYWIYRFNALGIDGIKDRVITQNLIKESLEKSIERDDLKRYERFDYIAKPEAK
ncbi:MAG: helix-turn-helix domain-containing protein [Nitrososphaerota archaeon]|nr:helix-turn-helix domain-containing protein [Nitrososphaerota archaeon]